MISYNEKFNAIKTDFMISNIEINPMNMAKKIDYIRDSLNNFECTVLTLFIFLIQRD